MQAINVPDSTPTKLANAGNRAFFHFKNDTGSTIYVCYDGSTADGAALSDANGIPIKDGETLILNNDGTRTLFDKAVWAYQISGGAVTCKVQGV